MRPKRSTAARTAASAVGEARDVQFDDEQVVGLADAFGHGVGVAAGGDDCVAGGKRGLGDVDAHAAAGTSDEPNSLSAMYLGPSASGGASPGYPGRRFLRRRPSMTAPSPFLSPISVTPEPLGLSGSRQGRAV